MVWKLVDIPEEETKNFLYNFKEKSKFIIDENMGEPIINFLKEQGLNVKHISDFGFLGHSDEDIFNLAYKKDRILVTHDKDFLDNKKFPLRICPGIVIIPEGNKDFSITLKALVSMKTLVGSHREVWKESKIIFNEDNTVSIISREFESGRIKKSIFKTERHNTFYWEQD